MDSSTSAAVPNVSYRCHEQGGGDKKNCTNSHKKRKGGGSHDASHCARSASVVTPSVADLRMRKLLTFWRQMRRGGEGFAP